MIEQIKEIVVYAAPLVAGFVTSIIIPIIIKKITVNKLEKKIDEINASEDYKTIQKELYELKKELYEIRGKKL